MTTKKLAKQTKWYTLADLEKKYGPRTVGDLLRSHRMCEEISQTDFADMLGLSRANLCDIEKGRKFVSLERAAKIADTLDQPRELLIQIALDDMLRAAKLKYRVSLKPA